MAGCDIGTLALFYHVWWLLCVCLAVWYRYTGSLLSRVVVVCVCGWLCDIGTLALFYHVWLLCVCGWLCDIGTLALFYHVWLLCVCGWLCDVGTLALLCHVWLLFVGDQLCNIGTCGPLLELVGLVCVGLSISCQKSRLALCCKYNIFEQWALCVTLIEQSFNINNCIHWSSTIAFWAVWSLCGLPALCRGLCYQGTAGASHCSVWGMAL